MLELFECTLPAVSSLIVTREAGLLMFVLVTRWWKAKLAWYINVPCYPASNDNILP